MPVKSLLLGKLVHPIKFFPLSHLIFIILIIEISVTSWLLYARHDLEHLFSIAQSLNWRGRGIPPNINPSNARVV